MIILRQRLYTRNDVKVLKELHQATRGFRILPKGYKNLTARDIYRINDLSTELYQHSKGNGNVNWENLETLTTHLGLPETSKYGQHAIEKFTNPELLERYRSIQAHRLGFGKEWAEATKLSNEYGALQKRYNEIEKEIKILSSKNSRDPKIDQLLELEDQTVWMMQNWERGNRKRYNTLKSLIEEKVSKIPETELPKFNTTIIKRSGNLLNKATVEGQRLEALSQNENLTNKIADEIKKNGMGVVRGSRSQYIPGSDTIQLASNNPATLGHEWNHKRYEDKLLRRKGIKTRTQEDIKALGIEQGGDGVGGFRNNPLYDVPHEIAASSLYLNSPIAKQATPLERANQERGLTKNFETYYHGTVGRLAAEIPTIPGTYRLPDIK